MIVNDLCKERALAGVAAAGLTLAALTAFVVQPIEIAIGSAAHRRRV